MSRRATRFTIYDALEANGAFDSNPANTYSRNSDNESLYKGPVQYPKMLYHPSGETRVLMKGEYESTIRGVQLLNEHTEIVHTLVHSKLEEEKMLAAGWHKSPAKAMGKDGPAETPQQTIEELQRQIAELTAGKAAGSGGLLGAGDAAD